MVVTVAFLALASLPRVLAQTCSTVAAQVAAPVVLPGYSVQLVANNVTKPRAITFDSRGRLLVIANGAGIESLTFAGNSSCLTLTSRARIVNDTSVRSDCSIVYGAFACDTSLPLLTFSKLNHGIAISHDGTTLYASK